MLQRECSKVGFDLQIKKVPNDGYWGAVWMKKPMNVSSWNMRPSAHIMLTLTNKSDAPWNEAMWKNERFDKLLEMSAGELDASKRAEMMCEAQKTLCDRVRISDPDPRRLSRCKSREPKGFFPEVPLGAFGGMEWARVRLARHVIQRKNTASPRRAGGFFRSSENVAAVTVP